jgi:nucleoside-diphosphate-sugar epimerase
MADACVLVTGATGFVASNFVRHLAEQGYQVVAYDVASPHSVVLQYWEPVAERIVFEQGSVIDRERISSVMGRHAPSLILHAAAVTAVDPVTETRQGAQMVEVNIMGTLRLLEAARHSSVRRMLYISSSGVYGTDSREGPISETAAIPEEGVGLYSLSKIASERLCLRYAELMDVDVVIGRLSGPYGPMERDTGVRPIMSPIYRLACAALQQDVVRIRKSEAQFDWTFTLDLARAARQLLEARVLRHRLYNLSGGQPYTLAEVATALEGILGRPAFDWVDPDGLEPVDVDIDFGRRHLDITRLRCDVGFAPAYALEDGLKLSMPWWRAMLASEDRLVRH